MPSRTSSFLSLNVRMLTSEIPKFMTPSTLPLFVIYVAWYPTFTDGSAIAKTIYEHYRRNLYENIVGGTGLSVFYRFSPEPGSNVPKDISFADAEASAIILFVDQKWTQDAAWVEWASHLVERAESNGLNTRVFPVFMDATAAQVGIAEQAVRWDKWNNISQEDRERRLITDLTYQFSRMLRSYLESLKRPSEAEDQLEQYLRKVEIFLSHSKHDQDGERIAKLIRQRLQEGDGLASFFDVHDIPIGLRFDKVILHKIGTSAVVAIHTDTYSSREWCRREIIEAKSKNVPLVVANCLNNLDERGFPYLGNVPIVRMDPVNAASRIDYVVSLLLDEVMKDFLWRCRIQLSGHDDVFFLPRPPELISLVAAAKSKAKVLVYPDPPIGSEEKSLFESIAPSMQLKCLTEWFAEGGL